MTPAIAAARNAGIAHDVHRYRHDPAAESYGLEAASALGIDPARVFKTLVVESAPRRFAVAIVPVAGLLDLGAMAAALGVKKVELAQPADAERSTGYLIGGISPLGQKRALPTVIDASAEAIGRVYVSAGRRGLEISLAPADLVKLTRATFAPISRPEVTLRGCAAGGR